MRDRAGRVIYVGKSRRLKNRVSQYFQAGGKNPKTERMASLVRDFEVVICSTEIEALTLENAFIKQHSPKYNLKLKDAKSYPYIKITKGDYPRLVWTRRREDDGAKYYGPYSSTSTVYSVLGAVNKALKLPSCKRRFPRDIGRGRPCIYYQMGRCCCVCTGEVSQEEYAGLIKGAAQILGGNTSALRRELTERMQTSAEEERFEEAARCRDIIAALDSLREKQKVVFAPGEEADVFALFDGGDCSAVSVLSVRDGVLSDKRYPSARRICRRQECRLHHGTTVRDYVPSRVPISFPLDEGRPTRRSRPVCRLRQKQCYLTPARRGKGTLRGWPPELFGHMQEAEGRETPLASGRALGLKTYPARIEAYDGKHRERAMRCGMIGCRRKFRKGDYRSFSIRGVEGTTIMLHERGTSRRAARLRRLGLVSEFPDLIRLAAAGACLDRWLLEEKGLHIPVRHHKDEYHKTRAPCRYRRDNIAKSGRYLCSFSIRNYLQLETEKPAKDVEEISLTEIPASGQRQGSAVHWRAGRHQSAELGDILRR